MKWACVLATATLLILARAEWSAPVPPPKPTPSRVVRLGGTISQRPGGLESASARAARQGIELAAQAINDAEAFRNWTVNVSIEDDRGDPFLADRIYCRMAGCNEAPEVDFLLGPSSTALSAMVARISNQTGRIAMLFAATTARGVFSRGYRNTFFTGVTAEEYMVAAVDAAWHAGARSLSVVWDKEMFNIEACRSAASHARDRGFDVLGSMALEESGVTAKVRDLQALGADALLACGDQRTAEEILLSARALNFAPEAMVISGAANWAFVDTVGPPNANYVLSPATWSPHLSAACSPSCPVFRSPGHFAELYRGAFGEEPLDQAAEAAAAVLALLTAVEAAGSVETEAVRTVLANLDTQTFYGRLAFKEDGTRRDVAMLAQQAQPLQLAADTQQARLERYKHSDIVLVGSGNATAEKASSWDQKELEIFPCEVGEAIHVGMNDANQTQMTCQECRAGRYRSNQMLACEDCEAGYYSDRPGMSNCTECPPGADCPETLRPGLPIAKPHFWRLPEGEVDSEGVVYLPEGAQLRLVECNPPGNCLGNNTCAAQQDGLLCAQCKPGWARSRTGLTGSTCVQCRRVGFSVFMISLTVLGYSFYIWLIIKAQLSASKSIKAVHSVILKIFVNYVQFAGAAFYATRFRDQLEEAVAAGWGGAATVVEPVIAIPEMLANPIEALDSFECLCKALNIKAYQGSVLIGMVLMPVSLAVRVGFGVLQKELVVQRLIPNLQRQLENLQAIAREAREMSLADSVRAIRSGRTCRSGQDASPAVPATDPLDIVIDDPTPMSPVGAEPLTAGTLMSAFLNRLVNSSIVMCFVLHPVVVRLLVVGFECVELDVLRQASDYDVRCRSEEHYRWLAMSAVGIVVYGFGMPLFLFCVLYNVRGRLFHAEVRKKFGFLYNGFELRYYYFEAVYMVRKVVIVLFFTFPTFYIRMVLMLFTSWGFILLHLRTQPFDNRSFECFDRLEMLSLRALSVTVAAGLVRDIREDLPGDWYQEVGHSMVVSFALVIVPLAFHVHFLCSAFWSLFRNSVLKHMFLKAEIWPDQIKRFERLLMCTERHQNLATWSLEDDYLCIDTSALSQTEEDYLFLTLRDTMERYMGCKDKAGVYPADLEAALKDALRRCQKRKRKRACRLELLVREQKDQQGVWSKMLRWKGELSLSLHGPEQFDGRDEETSLLTTLCGYLGLWRARRAKRTEDHKVAIEAQMHGKLEKQKTFTVEELYDALMPIWVDIAEGNGPVCVNQEEEYGRGRSRLSISDLLHGAPQDRPPPSRSGTQRTGTASSMDLGEVSHAVQSELGRSHSEKTLRSRASDPSDVHADLGLEQAGRTQEVRELLRQKDALVAENVQLSIDLDSLRRRLEAVSMARAVVPEARRALASPAEDAAEASAAKPLFAAALEASQMQLRKLRRSTSSLHSTPRVPTSPREGQGVQPSAAAGEIPPPSARSSSSAAKVCKVGQGATPRVSLQRLQQVPKLPNLLLRGTAAGHACPQGSDCRSAAAGGASPAAGAGRSSPRSAAGAAPVSARSNARSVRSGRSAARSVRSGRSMARSSSAGSSCSSTSDSSSGSSYHTRRRRPRKSLEPRSSDVTQAASPWAAALRPATEPQLRPRATQQPVANSSFAFMGAARPTSPDRWVNVDNNI